MWGTVKYQQRPLNGLPSIIPLTPVGPNLLGLSQTFSAWDLNDVTIDSTAVQAPDGELSAFKMIEGTNNIQHRVDKVASSCTTGFPYTLSVYAKPVERTWLRLIVDSVFDPSNPTAWFNLTGSGVVGSLIAIDTASIALDRNGYYRAQMSMTAQLTGVTRCYVQMVLADGGDAYPGDGTSGMIPWGAQLNPGVFATGYLRTN